MAFIFGGNTGNTYEGLQRQRKIAESLLAQNSNTPRNVGEGLAAIGNALAYRAIEKRAAKTEEKLRGEFDTAFSSVFGGGSPAMGAGGDYTPSGTWTPGAPPPKATNSYMGMPDVTTGGLSFDLKSADTGVSQGGNSFGSAVMTPQEMLIAGAKARGLDPIDVATAISYETGGKFDPLVKGPTTQWGQHEGLIQFGDPQGVEHGAVFDQGADAAWRSQLDPTNGAVWSYLESTGVKPGMGLDNIYSAINAGGVNRFTASDANNGGSPGTVADKVAGMGDHRANAARFLGGTWTPTPDGQPQPAQAPQMDLGTLSELAGNPYATPGQRAVLEALIGQQMQAGDPMRQIELQKAQLELAQLQNPKVDPMAAIELQQAQLNLDQDRAGVGAGAKEYGLTPQYGTDKDGNLVAIQFAKDGTSIATPLPEGVALSKGIEKLDLGDSYQYVNTMTGEYVGNPIAKNTAAEAANVVAGKAKGEAQAALDSLTAKMPGLESVVAELNDLADKATYTLGGQAWDATVKQLGGAPSASAIARAEYIAKVDNQVLPLLRDTFGAAFTAKEGDTLRATLGDPDKSPQEKKAVLNAFIEQKKRDLEALAKQTGEQPATANTGGADAGAMSDDDLLKMYGQ